MTPYRSPATGATQPATQPGPATGSGAWRRVPPLAVFLVLGALGLVLAGCDLTPPTLGATTTATAALLASTEAGTPSPVSGRGGGDPPSDPPATATATTTVSPPPTPTETPTGTPTPTATAQPSPSPSPSPPPRPAVSASPAPSPTPALLPAAQAEGKLTYFTSESLNEVQGLLRAFSQQYGGIATESWRAEPAGVVERLTADAASGQPAADVIYLAPGYDPSPALARGLLAAYAPGGRRVPAELGEGGEGSRLQPFVLTVQSIGFSTNLPLALPPPRTWADLTDPRWRGRLGLLDPRGTDDNWLMRVRAVQGDAAWREWVDALAGQSPRLYTSYGAMQLALASGEIWVMAPATPGLVEPARQQGAEINWVRAAEPLPAAPGWLGIPAAAPHPAAARLFVDWAVSAAGQRVIAAQGRVPARPGITAPFLAGVPFRVVAGGDATAPGEAAARRYLTEHLLH